MRKERKYHYIYKTTNVINGKYYIGMHSTDNLADGYIGSGKRLWFSINYHGKENHKVEILEYCNSREELKKREAEIVNEQLLNEDLCMNLTIGGQNGCGDYSVEKLLAFVTAGGKAHSERMKIDIEYRLKTIETLANNRLKAHNEGRIPYGVSFKGKKHTKETKDLIASIRKENNIGVGETNSQYGTCWITKDGLNKKIKKEDLESWLVEGWSKGRELIKFYEKK